MTKKDKQWIYNISDVYTTNSFTFIRYYINNLKQLSELKGLELSNEESNDISNNITALYNLQNFNFIYFKFHK